MEETTVSIPLFLPHPDSNERSLQSLNSFLFTLAGEKKEENNSRQKTLNNLFLYQ